MSKIRIQSLVACFLERCKFRVRLPFQPDRELYFPFLVLGYKYFRLGEFLVQFQEVVDLPRVLLTDRVLYHQQILSSASALFTRHKTSTPNAQVSSVSHPFCTSLNLVEATLKLRLVKVPFLSHGVCGKKKIRINQQMLAA